MLIKKLLRQKVEMGLPGQAYLLVSANSNVLTEEVEHIKSSLSIKPSEVIEVIPEEKKNGEISIGKIRILRSSLSKSSTSGRRLVIIHQADRFSEEAANSFLKTLEEPPADTSIVLLSPNQKIISTIASRCQLYQFPSVDSDYQLYNASEIEKIITQPLKELFLLADKIAKEGKGELLINDLTKYYYQRFKTDPKVHEIMNHLVSAKSHYQANVSERLIIENLFLLIYSEKKYGTGIKNN